MIVVLAPARDVIVVDLVLVADLVKVGVEVTVVAIVISVSTNEVSVKNLLVRVISCSVCVVKTVVSEEIVIVVKVASVIKVVRSAIVDFRLILGTEYMGCSDTVAVMEVEVVVVNVFVLEENISLLS